MNSLRFQLHWFVIKNLFVRYRWILLTTNQRLVHLTNHRKIKRSSESGELKRKTATLAEWQQKLVEYPALEQTDRETEYWQAIEKQTFVLPVDFETDDWRVEHLDKVVGTLSKEMTGFLLKDAHQAYKTDVPVLLNTALALSLMECTGQDKFIIEQENHGRHLDGIDTSRTIGWFTARYPLSLECKEDTTGNLIKAVKEQIRKVPNSRMGYGAYKYIRNAEKYRHEITPVRFNYLGQFGGELNNDLFSYTNRSAGCEVASENSMTARIELNLMIVEGQLNIEINYNKKAWKRATIEWWKDLLLDQLEKVLHHIREEKQQHFTPSDFEAVDLDDEELNALFH